MKLHNRMVLWKTSGSCILVYRMETLEVLILASKLCCLGIVNYKHTYITEETICKCHSYVYDQNFHQKLMVNNAFSNH